jgi:PKHD-type hydroxylase
MKGEWIYNMSYFSKGDCENLIEMAKELPAQDAGMGFHNESTNAEYRRTKVRWLDYTTHPQFEPVYSEFWKFVNRINHDWFNFNITYLPPLQFTEYTAEERSEYKSHQDVFWLNPTPRHRKLTLVLQLSDPADYEGGDLVLESVGEKPPAERVKAQGTLIAFPSFVYHALTPVTSGKRHSLVAWFEGPKFQ